MKKSILLTVLLASATAAMAAFSWPVGEKFPMTFPFPSEVVSPRHPFPVFPGSFPVFPQDNAFPEHASSCPVAAPIPAF